MTILPQARDTVARCRRSITGRIFPGLVAGIHAIQRADQQKCRVQRLITLADPLHVH